MDLRELHTFLVLANCLHFGKAANTCAMTPSTLSRIIKRLEDELEVQLFKRDNRNVVLTEQGVIFKKFAEQYSHAYNTMKAELNNLHEDMHGKIKLYCSVTASIFLLPSLLHQFRSKYPQIEMNIETGDAAMALQKLQANDVDLSIAAVSKSLPRDIISFELAKIPLVFIAPKDIPTDWYKDNDINWKQLPYIISEQGELRKSIDCWFKRHRITTPKIYAEIAGNEAIVSLVALGVGVALIPKAVVEQSSNASNVQVLLQPMEVQPFNVSLCVKAESLDKKQILAFVNMLESSLHQ